MIYDELTGEVIENPDLTKGKVYTEEKVIGHKEAQRVLLEGTITDFDPEGCWMEIPAEDVTETIKKYHKYTIDELIEQQQAAQKPIETSISQEKKLELLLNAIPTAAYPIEPPKVGYKWSPTYNSEAGFGWEWQLILRLLVPKNDLYIGKKVQKLKLDIIIRMKAGD